MGILFDVGILVVVLGIAFFLIGSKSRGEMKIRLGWFKGPIWFLLIVLGVFLMILDSVIL